MEVFWVFVGGGLGSLCRYGIARALPLFDLPIATFLANAISCLILGILIALSAKGQLSNAQRLLFMTGFCGGFSTFSTFAGESLTLMQNGHHFYAMANILLSVLLGLVFIYLGLKIVGT